MKSSPARKPHIVSVAALLPLALAGGVLLFCGGFYLREVSNTEKSVLAQESVQVDALAHLFLAEIRPVAEDLQQLGNGEGLRAYATNGQSAEFDRAIQQAVLFSHLNPEFNQIRYLDNRGQEVLRIDRNGRIVPPGELQDKSGRPFFQKTSTLAAGQMYLSAFDLSVENGRVKQPPEPMLRFAMPIFDGTGQRRGVYVINFLGSSLFSHLQSLRPEGQSHLRVLNAEGYWLKAAQPEQEWGFMFSERNASTLARTEPELWARLASEPNGQTRHAGGSFSWRRIDLRQSVRGSLLSVFAEDGFLVIASEISGQEFGALLARLRVVFGVLTMLLLASAIFAGRMFRSRRLALQALRRSEENLTVTLHSIGDAVLATYAGARVTRMNLVAEKLMGWTQAEAQGRPVAEVFRIINEETRQPSVIPVDKVLATGEIHGLANHTILIARDGTECSIADSAAPIWDKQGKILGVVLVFRDVTESRRAQAELDRFFSLSLDFLAISSADGYFKRVSPAVTDVLGWSTEEFLARPFLDFVHPEDQAATLSEVERQVVMGEKVFHFENRYRHKDGRWRVLAWRSVPGPGGMMYATARDVTEKNETALALHRAHADLTRANAELAQASRLKDEFLATMSHELRTPLNAILGLSEALLEQVGGTLTPRQVKSVTTISTSGQHLLALINDILGLSKIEAGALELHVEPLNVDEFCQGCLAFVRTQAMQKKIGVAFEPDGRAAKFVADPKRFKQVLVNLLTNAVKFTPEGGRIGLTVAASEGEDMVRFTVWDTGIGIASGDQGKLFRPFTQIDSGLTRAQDGTGLGLALVAKLVELHCGSLALESEPGKGSRFIVTLPQIARLAPEPAPQEETDRRGFRRALIIEDDATSGAILANYLTELGLTSALHTHGEQSVEAALRERPDVILLDIQLPNESGWVVLAKLKEHPGTRDIPVAVISVVDEPQKSRGFGAAAHFTKPVTRAQLAQFLQRSVVEVALAAAPCIVRGPGRGPRILLAEDNEANIQTLGGYLEDKDYEMHYAMDGLVAVKLARELRPALILMDIQMPVMDGLAAMKEIRTDAALKDIPIVALTALAMSGDRQRCLAAGATDYLSKPVSLKALAALVKQLLSKNDESASI